jgi:hypothetical protein
MNMKTRRLTLTLIGLVVILLLTACGQSAEPTVLNPVPESPEVVEATEAIALTEAAVVTEAVVVTDVPVTGEEIMNLQCTACHGISRITSTKASLEQWQAIVERMILKGAKLTEAEKAALVQYLAENYK